MKEDNKEEEEGNKGELMNRDLDRPFWVVFMGLGYRKRPFSLIWRKILVLNVFRGKGRGLESSSSCWSSLRRGWTGAIEVVPRDCFALGLFPSIRFPATRALATIYWLAHWSISRMGWLMMLSQSTIKRTLNASNPSETSAWSKKDERAIYRNTWSENGEWIYHHSFSLSLSVPVHAQKITKDCEWIERL